MPVYHHCVGIRGQHFKVHTGTMTIVTQRTIFKGAWVRDGKSDTSIAPLSQAQKENILFDQVRRFTTGWGNQNPPEWFYVVFGAKDDREHWVQFKFYCHSPYFTAEPMI